MVFFSMGKTNPKKLIHLLEKYTENLLQTSSAKKRETPQPLTASILKLEKDTSQAHTMIGSYSYPIHNPKRRALSLLNNILGGPGMNSRLNISLREKRGYVYNVESSLTSYSDAGLFAIYFGGDERNQQKCVELVMKELGKFRTTKLSTAQLAAAKKQYIGQISISHNIQENTALALGKSLFYFDRWFLETELVTFIEKLTAEQLLEVANELFEKDRLFCLQYN
jgi:predicted Zn-dependent peptidase